MEELLSKFDWKNPLIYWEFFLHQLQTNQIFAGLFVLSLLGTVAFILRSIPAKIFNIFQLQFTVELVVRSGDPLYDSLKIFLANTNYVKGRCRRLALSTPKMNGSRDEEESKLPEFILTPSSGRHWFFYDKKLICYDHNIEEQKGNERKESITLRYLGRSRNTVYKLVEELQALQRKEQNTISLRIGNGSWWDRLGRKVKRPMDTIFMPEEDKKFLMDDIEWFYNNMDWYIQRGIPYHRGYLFHGVPGTGKTSFIKAICSHYNLTLAICNLSSIKNDKELIDLMGEIPYNSIVILEDVDACGVHVDRSEDKKEDKDNKGVTLSGLLNVLDGAITPERQIFVMTTNHPEKLDPALLRAGRVDVQMEFRHITKKDALKMFLAYFPDREKISDMVLDEIFKKKHISPAEMQNMYMEFNKYSDIEEDVEFFNKIYEYLKRKNNGKKEHSKETQKSDKSKIRKKDKKRAVAG